MPYYDLPYMPNMVIFSSLLLTIASLELRMLIIALLGQPVYDGSTLSPEYDKIPTKAFDMTRS